MPWATIDKPASPAVRPNLVDDEAVRRRFRWDEAAAELDGLPGGRGLNMAHEAVDRHAAGPLRDRVAIRWLGKRGERVELTYAHLAARSNRFANVLAGLGVEPGQRVFLLAGRVPELYISVLGALKHRAVVAPLFSAFGPEPIATRLSLGDGRVLVTTPLLYRRKVAAVRDQLPGLRHVLVTGARGAPPEGTVDLDALMAGASEDYEIGPTDPEDMALLHFTSGTTGTPKGAVHVHRAVVAHYWTGRFALDLHPDDVFWCTADPGWVTGMSYGIVSPLTHGITMVVDEAEFDADRWYSIIQDERVTVWYTAPTAVRMMMRIGAEAVHDYDTSSLRFLASVGEPLNPEAVVWGQEVFGLPFHDNWWQTETGGIMIANLAALPIRPGSMGRALPGIEVGILRCAEGGEPVLDADGHVQEVAPGEEGMLSLRPGWPSMFRGYLHDDQRYQRCFVDGWYLSGDLAWRDAEGYVWFVGRADDVIKSAGHLIGPFEVESALMEHDAVAEAGVFAKPDPVAGNVVKAVVSLRPGVEPTEELRAELLGFARTRLGAAVAPREIDFDQQLPKTKSGKIMRRVLRARELGLPEGDLSTLETGGADAEEGPR
ncbi:MAG: acetate--CoA ligase [Acidimicrobiales bacterium]|nr:acetate--CoA ligase [Acidimicrobiales bacterium]